MKSPKSQPLQSLLQPFKAVWYKSWTKFLGWVQGVFGSIILLLGELRGYISDPTFTGYLDKLDLPKAVSVGFVILGILTWLAHGRENNA